MSRRSGLGRGLAALIPPSPTETDSDPSEVDDLEETSSPSNEDERDAAAPSEGEPSDERTEDQRRGWSDVRERTSADASSVTIHAEPPRPSEPMVTEEPVVQATLAELEPHVIVPNPRQPREVFDEEEIEGLAVSLADVGMLQPIVVRPMGEGRYELIAGERRLRAAKLAGLATVPAVVRHTDDIDLLKEALVENIHRVQLNPLEEAAAYQQMLEEFEFTQEELAERIGKSRPAISNTLRLLGLPPAVQRRVAAGVLSAGHAKALLALDTAADQERLADRIVAEGMSVRGAEEAVRVRLLDESGGTRRSRGGGQRRLVAPGLIDLQDDLSDALEARVRITMGARKGKLTVEFASVDDLERIVAVIAGGLETGAQSVSVPREDLE